MRDGYIAPQTQGQHPELVIGAETEFGLVEEGLAYIADALRDIRRDGAFEDIVTGWSRAHGEKTAILFKDGSGCVVKDEKNLVGVAFFKEQEGTSGDLANELVRVESDSPRTLVRINILDPVHYRPAGPGGRPFLEFIMGDKDYGAKFFYAERENEFGFNPGPIEAKEIDLKQTPLEEIDGYNSSNIRHLLDGGSRITRELYNLVREVNPFATKERFFADAHSVADLLAAVSGVEHLGLVTNKLNWSFHQATYEQGPDYELLSSLSGQIRICQSNGSCKSGRVFPWAAASGGPLNIGALHEVDERQRFNSVEFRYHSVALVPDIVMILLPDGIHIVAVESDDQGQITEVRSIGIDDIQDTASLPANFSEYWPMMCRKARSMTADVRILDSMFSKSRQEE